ncbi:holo-ACP synthase [Ligilactobacillus hohenheimensis]|uniref:holo-ACP synthase n=1 Tax=Ligilactobacillus hohenheimensis TaxID=2991832 RepID=UPI0024BA15DF|nr:4'-phosphopantetheinyl transferase superfamily protein [Ligilactobacillus hohenheimensis]
MIQGIGLDIQNIGRIERIISNHRASVVDFIYTKQEWNLINSYKNGMEIATVLFSLKESVSKSLGTGIRGFKFSDIEILVKENKLEIKFSNNIGYLIDSKMRWFVTIVVIPSVVITNVVMEK